MIEHVSLPYATSGSMLFTRSHLIYLARLCYAFFSAFYLKVYKALCAPSRLDCLELLESAYVSVLL